MRISKENITELYDDGTRVEMLIQAARTTALLSSKMVYLLDLKHNRFLYVSDHLSHRIGLTDAEIERMSMDFYYSHLSEENSRLFAESAAACRVFLKDVPEEQRENFIAFANMCMTKDGKDMFVCHKFIPISFDDGGELEFVLCMADRSHRSEQQVEVFIKDLNRKMLYVYDFDKHSWREEPAVLLSDVEKSVLNYSSYGYSNKRIASEIYKSEDTVKSYRKSIFSKIGVDNINEAISITSFYNMI